MITRMLELSTEHLSESTVDLIEMKTNDIPVFYDKAGRVWFPVLVPESWPHTMPADLKGVFEHAAAQNCAWVMFDRDCDTLPSLPTFEW